MNFSRLFMLWIGLIATFSCSDDFLDKPPLTTITDANFPSTPDDALLVTNSVYNAYRNWRIDGGFPLLDIMSDDQTPGSEDGSNPDLQLIETFEYSPSHPYILPYYQTLYLAIRRANIVTENVPSIAMDEDLKARYIAEAKFIRALTYFRLVGSFGGVSIVDEVNPELFVQRSTEDEVLDFIEQDLLDAMEVLPEKSAYSSADAGRATKGAAKALMARVSIFRGDFVDTETYALEVINSGQYSLAASFSDVYDVANVHGDGSVFEVGALPEGSFAQGGNQYGNTQGVRGTPNWGWGFGRPSWDIINFYQSNDPRMDASIIFLGEELHGVLIEGNSLTTDTTRNEDNEIIEIECYNQKVYVDGAVNTQENFGHNRKLIRYADVLLMAAEALNENNQPALALNYLNMVRARARGGDPSILPDIVTTDKDELRSAIWEERRAELAFETLRFLDLKRQGRLADVLGSKGFIEGKHEYLPIPQQERDLSGGRLTQNDNW